MEAGLKEESKKRSLNDKQVTLQVRLELKKYVKQVYKGFPPIMILSDGGWLCVLHEHWKYLNPKIEAPRVYLGGKINITPTYIWLA